MSCQRKNENYDWTA